MCSLGELIRLIHMLDNEFFLIALMAHPIELYLTIGLVTQTIGYISLSMNSIAAYSSQNLFGKVRKDYEVKTYTF